LIGDSIERKINGSLKHALNSYLKVASNEKPSRMKIASTLPAQYSSEFDVLLREHHQLDELFHKKFSKTIWDEINDHKFSYLDLKIEIADKIFKYCILCEKKCRVNRGFESGACSVKKPRIASEFLHMGEELPLVPSHTIFFAGCNLECVYCQNWDISQYPDRGLVLEPEKLAKIIDLRRKQGSMNVNFVGGDPTPNIPYIFKTMKNTKENIPVVWNSNMFLSEISMKLLDGFVDLYLTDFKYGNNACAERLSGISNYTAVVRRNHKIAKDAGDMIIRHLIIPNHVECCSKPLLKWISDNLGLEVVINIMSQYRPTYNASKHQDVSFLPTQKEIREVHAYAEALGFVNLI
jgi:putative pyruvate formate lyase activating enzyme